MSLVTKRAPSIPQGQFAPGRAFPHVLVGEPAAAIGSGGRLSLRGGQRGTRAVPLSRIT